MTDKPKEVPNKLKNIDLTKQSNLAAADQEKRIEIDSKTERPRSIEPVINNVEEVSKPKNNVPDPVVKEEKGNIERKPLEMKKDD